MGRLDQKMPVLIFFVLVQPYIKQNRYCSFLALNEEGIVCCFSTKTTLLYWNEIRKLLLSNRMKFLTFWTHLHKMTENSTYCLHAVVVRICNRIYMPCRSLECSFHRWNQMTSGMTDNTNKDDWVVQWEERYIMAVNRRKIMDVQLHPL